MLIDGEKYACEACVRGHRVSNCNHYERPLTHINKKGRPVSQCPHCRGLRKARSSHVKCECGDKGKTGSVSPTKRGDKCTCGQGQRCTCALKKDHLAPINEIKHQPGLQRSRSHTDASKPRSSASPGLHADHPLTKFQNGHHMPVHHRNHAHELGLPYKIPRPHSIHGNSALARASTDSLPLLSGIGSVYPYEFTVQQDDGFHHSAHNSPALKPKVDMLNQLPQLDLSYTAINTDISSLTSSPQPEDFTSQPYGGMGYFSGVEQSTPLSALSGPPVDLSAMDLQAYDYPPAFTPFDSVTTSHPGLTNSSSGEVSDAEEYLTRHSPAGYVNSPYLAPQEPLGYNMSTDSLGPSLTPPSSMPASGGMNGPPMGVGSPIPHLSPDLEADPYAHHFTLQEAQKMAHPDYPKMSPPMAQQMAQPPMPQPPRVSPQSSRVPSPPQFHPTSDPAWAAFTGDEAAFLPAEGGQGRWQVI